MKTKLRPITLVRKRDPESVLGIFIMKTCSKCKQTKPIESFSKNIRNKDGLESQCSLCRKEYMVEYNKKPSSQVLRKNFQKQYYKPKPTLQDSLKDLNNKICGQCKQEKPKIEFNNNKNSKDGLTYNCKDCVKTNNNKKPRLTEDLIPKNPNNKICSQCKKEQSKDNFYKNKAKKSGLGSVCKKCATKYYKPRTTQDLIAKDSINNKICRKCKIEKPKKEFSLDVISSDKLNYKCKECRHDYNQLPHIKIIKNSRLKFRYKNDPQFKYLSLIRKHTHRIYKGEIKDQRSIELLGCTVEEFKQHLESQFLPEMTHENHGTIWEIDHITPMSSFDLTNEEERRKACHYTNLQPLFKTTAIAESFGYENEIGNRNKRNF